MALSLSPFRGQEQEGEEGEEGRRLRGSVGARTAGTVSLQSADCFLIERVKQSVCTGTIMLALLLRSPSKTNMAAGRPGSRPRRASFSQRSSCLHDRGELSRAAGSSVRGFVPQLGGDAVGLQPFLPLTESGNAFQSAR